MIRIALILLAIYTTALSCIPCSDQVLAVSYGDTVTLKNSDVAEKQALDVDLCTPFCTCSCCASVSLQRQIASLPTSCFFSTFEDITFAYLSRAHSGDLTSIWQPPRA